jgi:hypothetical protein
MTPSPPYAVKEYSFMARTVRNGELIESGHDCDLQAAMWCRAFKGCVGHIFVRAGKNWRLFKTVSAKGRVTRAIPYFNDSLCRCKCQMCFECLHDQCEYASCDDQHCGCKASKLSPEERLLAAIDQAWASPPEWVVQAGVCPELLPRPVGVVVHAAPVVGMIFARARQFHAMALAVFRDAFVA